MASTVNVRQKSSTFRCEWITTTYNTKSENFSLEINRDEVDDDGLHFLREKNCCVGVKHVPRLGRYVLYFVSRCRIQSGYEIAEVFITTHPAATRLPMTRSVVDGARVFSYELQEWKTPITSTFWVLVTETIPYYSFSLCDTMAPAQLWKGAVDGLFTDVTFTVGGQNFPAHKFIVSVRSPVLMAMFSSDMSESRTNHVTIEDCDPIVFGRFLAFLYTGRLVDAVSSRQQEELWAVADKYQVETLKALCASKPTELKASDVTSLILSL